MQSAKLCKCWQQHGKSAQNKRVPKEDEGLEAHYCIRYWRSREAPSFIINKNSVHFKNVMPDWERPPKKERSKKRAWEQQKWLLAKIRLPSFNVQSGATNCLAQWMKIIQKSSHFFTFVQEKAYTLLRNKNKKNKIWLSKLAKWDFE